VRNCWKFFFAEIRNFQVFCEAKQALYPILDHAGHHDSISMHETPHPLEDERQGSGENIICTLLVLLLVVVLVVGVGVVGRGVGVGVRVE